MALTRKMLEGMGISAEAIEAIVEANSSSLSAIKAERDSLKLENERLSGELSSKEQDFKAEIDKVRKEYEDFKTETTAKAVRGEKEKLYSEFLVANDIPQARVGAILRLTDFDAIEVEDGKLKDEKKLKGIIEKEWADYIMKTNVGDDTPAHPPAKNGVSGMTKEDILKIKDPVERQNKIKEHIDLFQN